MKKESKKRPTEQEESLRREPSLHDLYFTEDIDLEEELRLVAEDPKLQDVSLDLATLDRIKEEWAHRKNTESEMSQELTDIRGVVPEEDLAHLSPETRELLELGMKVKAQEDEPKPRLVRKRSKRILFAVAAIVALSLAGSTTGVTSMFKYLQIQDVGEEVEYRFMDSEVDMEISSIPLNEKEAYEQVGKFFGIPVVQIHGYQADLDFQQVLLHEEDMSADIVYYWEGKAIYYTIQSNYNQLSQMATAEDALVNSWEERRGDVLIHIEKYEVTGVEEFNYMIYFEHNNLYYKITALRVKEVVGENILKYLFI